MTKILTPAVRLHHFRLQFWRPTVTTGSLRYITWTNAEFWFSVRHQKNYTNQKRTQFLIIILSKCLTWDVYTDLRTGTEVHKPWWAYGSCFKRESILSLKRKLW